MKTAERIIYLFIIVALIILYFRSGCNSEPCPTIQPVDTSVTITPHQVIDSGTTINPPSAYTEWPDYPGTPLPDTFFISVDSSSIAQEAINSYINQHQYDDVIPETIKKVLADWKVKRSYTNKYKLKDGTLTVSNEVSQNKLLKQTYNINFTTSDTSTTITNNITPPARAHLLAGLEIIGSKQTPFFAAGPSLSYLSKKMLQVDASVLYGNDKQLWYKAGIKIKIF